MKRSKLAIAVAAGFLLAVIPAAPLLAADTPEQQRAQAKKEVPGAIAAFKKADPGIDKFFSTSAGYVVFPKVGKVGLVIGGGHGIGEVFEGGKSVGTATMSFGTVGLQAGIQEFSEIIFFQNAATLDRFKQDKFEFTANASVVIVKVGASASANYRDGVVVFTRASGGAMGEASVGGQKFKFTPEGMAAKK
jgi:lipid-binding SYLF domain-containing protein